MDEKEYREQIYKKADAVKTKKDLDKLLKEIAEFGHDYGTIVYGCMAAMKGAFNFINRSPEGGITGFQAGCLGWECVKEFMYINGPAKLIDYENLLYPQYADKFEKTISKETWEHVQTLAKANIEKATVAAPQVLKHWKSIASGRVPFEFRVLND